jgi:LacI family transcriptional regulator
MRLALSDITLLDVSREAGVSLATADRVLNGRAGVRSSTAERVRRATEKLGYRANPFAARLARKDGLRLAFVLPVGDNAFMGALAREVERIAAHLAGERTRIDIIRTDVFVPARLAQTLEDVGTDYQAVAVVALDHPLVRDAIDGLIARGISVATLVSDVPASKRLRYIGIDNMAAGRTAGSLLGRFVGPRSGPIGVVVGSAELRDHAERLFGFTQVLLQDHPGLQVLPPEIGQDDDLRSRAAAERILHVHPGLVGLYSVGAGTAGLAQAVQASGRAKSVVVVAHELTTASRALLLDGTIDALIHQDPGHEARSAARILVADLTRAPILPDQERIRIEVFVRDNLP